VPRFHFLKFFPADYIQDTRILSLSARGAWMDLLCAMWVSPERGKITWAREQYDRYWGTDYTLSQAILAELERSGVCDISVTGNGEITAMSRRMFREEHERKQAAIRQKRFRNAHSNGGEAQKLEARYKKEEEDTEGNAVPSGTANESLSIKDLVESWNEIFNGKLPRVTWPLSDHRRAKVVARLREHPQQEFWQHVFDTIGGSGFLLGLANGKGHGKWKCTFDFLIENDTNAVKIFEGGYGG
jgi:uncharacterized protein YdaU (DUF1376 family)